METFSHVNRHLNPHRVSNSRRCESNGNFPLNAQSTRFVAFCIIDVATMIAKCLKWPFCVKVVEPSLSKDLKCFTFMKSLIYHLKKTSWSQTGSRHLTQSGVKLAGSPTVGDLKVMETLQGGKTAASARSKSPTVGDLKVMETRNPLCRHLQVGRSPTVGDLKVMETWGVILRDSHNAIKSPTVGDLKVMETKTCLV